MKKLMLTSILAVLVAGMTTVRAQDLPEEYLGLPGDNLNLYAVMNLFQESETIEGFEKSLNDQNSRINNLDLNGDNLVDYIAVMDYVDGDVHNIVLRATLDRNEFQDVAVFTVQRFDNGSVQIQLVGDEDLYGKNYIIEPIYAETPNPGYRGKSYNKVNVTIYSTTPYEIAYWPVVRFIYQPHYVVWRSHWYWGYYPDYWSPWNPWYYHYYYGYHYNWHSHYYSHFHHWDHYRYHRYNDFYYGSVRAHSTTVDRLIREGHYKPTYSRPEQRREGEAYYARTQGDRNIGSREANPANNREVRPASQSERPSDSKGNTQSTVRRATGSSSTTERTVSKPAPAQRTEATGSTYRRTTPSQSAETNRQVSRPSTPSASSSRSDAKPSATTQKAQTGSQGSRSSSPAVSSSGSSSRSSAPAASSSRSSSRSSAPAASSSRSSSRSSTPAASSSRSSSRSSTPAASSSRSGSSKSSNSGNVSSKNESRSSSEKRSGR